MDEYAAEVYADFCRYYPTFPWPALVAGEMAPGLFIALLQGLPQESALRAAWAGGPEHRVWTLDTYLLATVVDLLQGANYQRAMGKGTKPKPLPRPDVKNRKTSHQRFEEVLRRARGQDGRSGG